MLTAFLLSLSPALQSPAHIEAFGADGFEFAGSLESSQDFTSAVFVLPSLTTNERVARLVRNSRGLRLRIVSPGGSTCVVEGLELFALEHESSQQVLMVAGELMLVSEPRLPSYARRLSDGRNRLPELARCDLASVRAETLLVAPAVDAGDRLVLIGEEQVGGELECSGALWSLPSDPTSALILPASQESKLELRVGARLDQLFHAAVVRVELEALERCKLRKAWSFEALAIQEVPYRGRGPARRLLVERGKPSNAVDVNAWPQTIAPGEALELRFVPAPRSTQAEGARAHTYVLRVTSKHQATKAVVEAGSSTVSASAPYFVDRFRAEGLDAVHFEGPHDQRDIRPTMGPGAAWGDVDGDGLQDLLLVQGAGREGCEVPSHRLYRNTGEGFEQLSTLGGGAGMGALFFDLEGDGDLDLYVANYGADRLYRNDGTGEFEDISEEQGIGGELWSAGVCAGDVDGDGDLELYVTSYLNYDPALMPPVEELPGFRREDPLEMLPFAFPAARNTFYENRGGKLVDVSEARGLQDLQGRGMQAVFWDFDLDGDLDLYIANDVSFNVLLRNDGAGNFEDISFQTGMDDPRGGMGVALGDVDGDLDEDLFLTNWQLEANALYLNNYVASGVGKAHVGTFQDGTVRSGLGPAGVGVTSWGAVLFDADNDGDRDLFIPNGYTSPDYESTGICVGQPNQFFLNDGEGRFVDASAEAGADVTAELASRCVAVCDYDRDGRLDLLVTTNNGPAQLLHNELPSAGHWLGIRLRGSGGNPFAIGARVELEAGELALVRTLTAGEGYLAGHAAELHFGLGENERVDKLSIHWPSGATTTHVVDGGDEWIIREE